MKITKAIGHNIMITNFSRLVNVLLVFKYWHNKSIKRVNNAPIIM